MLLVVIGLYLLVLDSRIQDLHVKVIGTHTSTVATGVMISTVTIPTAGGAWPLIVMVTIHTPTIRRVRVEFVPSDVLLIDYY